MKPLIRHLAVAIFLCFGSSAIAQHVDPEILIDLDFSGTNCTQCGDAGKISIGLDTNGSDAYDDTLDIPGPPPLPGSGGRVIFNSDVIQTGFTLDVRQLGADNITWTLDIDNGLPPQDITATWTAQEFIDLGAESYISAELRSSDGTTLLADLTAANTHVFTGAGTTALIVIKQGANAAPVANDDTKTVFSSDVNVPLDVLLNDVDADGDNLTITHVTMIDDGFGAEGTVAINGAGNALVYEPPASNLFAGNTTDTFTYTIDDGTDTATATVTVTVFSDDLVATRSHAALSKAGETAEDGLVVTVSLQFSDALRDDKANITTLDVKEDPPIDDEGSGNYSVAEDAGNATGLDIGGVLPTEVQGNGNSTVVFTFDANDIDANGLLEFTYRLVGPDTDRGPVKVIDGEVTYDQGSGDVDVTIPQTQFAAVGVLNHSADYRAGLFDFSPFEGGDSKIDAGELSRVVDYFRNGGYHAVDVDTTNPDGFSSGFVNLPDRIHSADYRSGLFDLPPFDGGDGKIDAGELSRVVDYFRNTAQGGYQSVDKSDTDPDGFEQIP